jgi:hypothetical protein
MGIEVFTDVLKFTPIGADLSVIEDIAEMVLGVRTGGGGGMVGPGPGGVNAVAGANTVTATVPPGGGPYKVTITIEPMSGPATSTTHVIGETSPPPPVPGDHSGPPTPPQDGPAANPAGTSEPPAATPTPPSSALPRTATPAE